MRFSQFLLLGALISLLPTESAGQHRVIHSEIDGVPLVRTEGGPKYDGPLFDINEELVLGVDEGEPEWQLFYGSPSLIVAPDGRMVLVDIRKCAVYIVSREGQLIKQLGGSGSGPGEFRQPYMEMWVIPGESFLINDYALNRATTFSMSGEILSIDNYAQAMGGRAMRFNSLGSSGFLAKRGIGSGTRVTGRPHESVTEYWFLNSQFEPVGEPFIVRSKSSFATGPNTGSGIPFMRATELIPYQDGQTLLVDPTAGRFTILSEAREPSLIIERDWERPRLSAQDRREGQARYLESNQAYMRRVAAKIPFPTRYAAFSKAFTDDRGRIWVEYMNGPSWASITTDYVKYDVFGPDGVWLGVHEFDFYPWHISGDYVYRRLGLEGEGPRLRRYTLTPIVPEAAGEIHP